MHGNVLGLILSLLLIGAGYVLHQLVYKMDRDLARKILHIWVSNWYFIYFYCFTDDRVAISGLLAFAVINFYLERRHFHTQRYGTVYFPMSIVLMILLMELGRFPMQALGCGILVMGYGDGLAAIAGSKIKSPHIRFTGGKTVAGSIAMFLVSTIVVLLVARTSLLYALMVGAAATVFEAFIPWGLDNFSVPLVVFTLVSVIC